MNLRIMTFNIRNGLSDEGANSWANRRHLTAMIIREANADVFGLQEVYNFQLSYLLSELPEYECYSVGREDGVSQGEQCSILWRRDAFHRLNAGTFWLSDTPDVPNSMTWGNRITRICSWVEFEEGFCFYNTHWDHESELARRRSGELIGQVLPETPWILVGDFNAEPSSREVFGLAAGNGIQFVTGENRHGTFHDFQGGIDGPSIDHIFASEDFSAGPIEILTMQDSELFSSDHYPVVCELNI